MPGLTNDELIARAAAVVRPKQVGPYLVGDVGAALVTATGNVYVGVCIDAASGMGFCAEHSAIAAMVTAREYQIRRVVAVWKDEAGEVFILPPCGRCREFIRQIHDENIEAEVIVGPSEVVTLRELLPMAGRFQKLSGQP